MVLLLLTITASLGKSFSLIKKSVDVIKYSKSKASAWCIIGCSLLTFGKIDLIVLNNSNVDCVYAKLAGNILLFLIVAKSPSILR